ncbi:hypothetical protein BDW59DRAFT_148980 [Aspergillus cavernicola]|uniref:NAD(P)-binding protein n=1 Tax=Aspergillus cavernicola TaxID=176166 RepID=A0ABR4I6E7_9EURO
MSALYGLLFTKLKLPPASAIHGKTILITGANTGLGREAARHALSLGAGAVILGVRTLTKGEQAKIDIESSTGCSNKVLVWPIDLESFASVQAFAGKVSKYVDDGGRLDIAIMNAGFASMEWAITGDGWERSLQANVLSTALLSLELLPVLLRSAERFPSSSSASTRPHLTIVASDIHRGVKFSERSAGSILSALNDHERWKASQGLGGATERYAVTKLLDIFITMEIARLAPRDERGDPLVIVNSLTPGFCKSDLLTREKAPLLLKVVQAAIARTVEEGSKTLLHAATAGVETHGLWMENQAVADPGSIVTDSAMVGVREKIWKEVVDVLREVNSEIRTEY